MNGAGRRFLQEPDPRTEWIERMNGVMRESFVGPLPSSYTFSAEGSLEQEKSVSVRWILGVSPRRFGCETGLRKPENARFTGVLVSVNPQSFCPGICINRKMAPWENIWRREAGETGWRSGRGKLGIPVRQMMYFPRNLLFIWLCITAFFLFHSNLFLCITVLLFRRNLLRRFCRRSLFPCLQDIQAFFCFVFPGKRGA